MRLKLWLIALIFATFVAVPRAFADDRPQQADKMRLKLYELGQSILPPEQVGRNTTRDLEIVEQLPAIKEHLSQVEKEYSQDIATGKQPYRNLSTTIEYVRERIAEFEMSATKFAALEAIQADVDHIRKMSAMAIENEAPAYFRPENDIAIYTHRIAQRRELLEKLGAESSLLDKAKKLADAAASEVKQAQTKLLDGILNQNELPSDNYSAADREVLLKLVKDTWLAKVPDATILQVGLIGDSWNRSQAWEIQNRTLYKVDRSRMQGFVLVAHDKQTVACRRVQLNRDHINDDKTTGWIISDPKVAPEPFELILNSKLKK